MNIYIIDFWEKFPLTEYGGIIIVIAKSNSEVIDLIKKKCWEHGLPSDEILEKSVESARQYELHGDNYESKIIEEFIT